MCVRVIDRLCGRLLALACLCVCSSGFACVLACLFVFVFASCCDGALCVSV